MLPPYNPRGTAPPKSPLFLVRLPKTCPGPTKHMVTNVGSGQNPQCVVRINSPRRYQFPHPFFRYISGNHRVFGVPVQYSLPGPPVHTDPCPKRGVPPIFCPRPPDHFCKVISRGKMLSKTTTFPMVGISSPGGRSWASWLKSPGASSNAFNRIFFLRRPPVGRVFTGRATKKKNPNPYVEALGPLSLFSLVLRSQPQGTGILYLFAFKGGKQNPQQMVMVGLR